MKVSKIALFIFFLVGFSTNISAQFVTVNDTYTAQQLVQDVLINSPCANVENFTVNGDPFHPGEQSYGFFDGNGSSFPFANGIVLSTARANRSGCPNDNLIDEGSDAWEGDTDLEAALEISHTLNATVLEFDFTPLTDYVSFDYIFASEEYHGTAPCDYSDGFAFLLKEANSSGPYTNLAVLPDGTSVLVTSVHPQIGDGVTNGGCMAKNENFFGGYNGTNAPINFNGQTTVLTAKSTVTPNVKYHIKLVIADEGNVRYDSAIFLGGGSFKVGADLGPTV
ncbi:choice-of-anchor L domain-containing protein [Flavobacterium sp. 3HN19-14]|uniref:choice-of-anchor L domain-containing protein n=1 Tax=Flavobacterium sp. 3HN19-14 TaxID=3448133 RepID=UPI003EDF184F